MTVQASQVFISYQRSDSEFARQVREHLTAHGVTTWMDQFDIPVGAYWPDEIDKGLSGSDVVIGVLSPDAVESRNVKNEWDWALQNDKRLLLLQYRPCVVPHRYVSINFIDATAADPTRSFAALLSTLGVPGVATAGSSVEMSHAGVPTRHGGRRPGPRLLKPLVVGREAEQARLTQALETLLDGQGSLVLLGGEAGIGKTTLTGWLLAEAEERGALALSGGCYDLTTTPPYGPWSEIIRQWPVDASLPDVPPELRGGEAIGAIRSQAALLETAGDFLARAAAVRPLVVLLEDVHWADQASLDLLRYLARTVAHERLLLVTTYRDDEIIRRHPLFGLLPALTRETGAIRLTLPRLADGALLELIAARYTLAPADANRLAVHLQSQTEGNPLFASEALRALGESGAIVRTGAGYTVGDLARAAAPALVREVIESRLARLDEEQRRALEVAAVIGHEVPVELWLNVSGNDDATLSDAMERAVDARLIEELRGGAGFRFTHALIRETLYEGLVLLRRRSWHRKAAEALAAAGQPDPDAVAHHFQQAGDGRAHDWLVRAGERAENAFSWPMAAARYEAALTLLDETPGTDAARALLLYRIGFLLRYTNHARSLAYQQDALRLARASGNRAVESAAWLDFSMMQFWEGLIEAGIAGMQGACDLFDALSPVEQASVFGRPGLVPDGPLVNSNRGVFINMLGHMRPADEVYALGHDYIAALPEYPAAQLVTSHTRWLDAYMVMGEMSAALGKLDESQAYFERSEEEFERVGEHFMVAAAINRHIHELELPYRADNPATRIRMAQRQISIKTGSLQQDDPLDDVDSQYPIGMLFIDGQWTVLLDTFTGHRGHGFAVPILQPRLERYLAEVYRLQGDLTRVWDLIDGRFPAGPATEPGQTEVRCAISLLRTAAMAALDAGDAPLALPWIGAHGRWGRWGSVVWSLAENLHLRAQHAHATGQLDVALGLAQQSLTSASEPCQPLNVLAANRLLGELETVVGRYEEADRHLLAALTLADACAAPFERALTLLASAELHAARGQQDGALRLLAEVRAICEPLRARPTLERVAALETRLV